MKAERRETILDAYERCIVRHGVEGTTLEQLADEAGLARALIRHNVGNKEDLLNAYIERFLDRSKADTELLMQALPAENRVAAMLDYLFDPRYANSHATRAANALMAASHARPDLAGRMRDWFARFVAEIASELSLEYPDCARADVDDVAAGIAGIYANVDAMAPLGPMNGLRDASRRAAHRLVNTLAWRRRCQPGFRAGVSRS
ncbi:MAG: TetR/AcrR family transcriptional regulator [Pseudomonadota bacterium]